MSIFSLEEGEKKEQRGEKGPRNKPGSIGLVIFSVPTSRTILIHTTAGAPQLSHLDFHGVNIDALTHVYSMLVFRE